MTCYQLTHKHKVYKKVSSWFTVWDGGETSIQQNSSIIITAETWPASKMHCTKSMIFTNLKIIVKHLQFIYQQLLNSVTDGEQTVVGFKLK